MRTYWACTEPELREFLALEARAEKEFFASFSRGEAPPTFEPSSPLRLASDGTAVISITGILLKTVSPWLRRLGIDATSYLDVQASVSRALLDPNVKRIRLDVSSPGGEVAGAAETADAIFNARKQKPVVAQIADIGASGAYWLASQALHIEANQNALVGSIGVYATFEDSSEAAAGAGVKVHVVASGSLKGMGVPGVPITTEQLAAMQESINAMADSFVRAVATGRRVPASTVQGWASGRVWDSGAAKELGLIDGVLGSAVRPSVRLAPRADSASEAEEKPRLACPRCGSKAKAVVVERPRPSTWKWACCNLTWLSCSMKTVEKAAASKMDLGEYIRIYDKAAMEATRKLVMEERRRIGNPRQGR